MNYIPGIEYQFDLPEINIINTDDRMEDEDDEIYDDEEVNVTDSIEHLDLTPSANPIMWDLDMRPIIEDKIVQSRYNKIRGMFDSGASINCIHAAYARKRYKKFIRNIRGFYVRTADRRIVLNQYIEFINQIKFYLITYTIY